MDIVILGLSITSAWGNGHATTFRSLVRALAERGHRVLFLERDVPWYADNRDLPRPPWCRLKLYESVADLKRRFASHVATADAVIVGSFVPEGIQIGQWVTRVAQGVTAFYDIDTPVTLAKIDADNCDYLSRRLIPRYHLYLSFTGGPTLERLEREYGASMAKELYCSVDPLLYRPMELSPRWDLGYLGTYSADRQPGLAKLLLEPARRLTKSRFIIAGPQYPTDLTWPANVQRVEHLPPDEHSKFYNRQRFTLNLTRAHMIRAGYSPSVRLFEAAACGTPVISDPWRGIETLLRPDQEIILARNSRQVISVLRDLDDTQRRAIGRAARQRILAEHTAEHRAAQLETYLRQVRDRLPLSVRGKQTAGLNDYVPARSRRAVR